VYLSERINTVSGRSASSGPTSESDIIEMYRGLDHLNFATNIIFFDTLAKINDGRVCWVISTKHFDGFIDLVGFVDIVHYLNVGTRPMIKLDRDIPVRIARASSSRGSRNAKRAPGAMESLSMSSFETSRVMGMEKSVPSARRMLLTTLKEPVSSSSPGGQ
jgi:hypothetical protein